MRVLPIVLILSASELASPVLAQTPLSAGSQTSRTAWNPGYPYLDLQEGLDSTAMKRLGWFKDNIHLAQPGGQGIGETIARLFLP